MFSSVLTLSVCISSMRRGDRNGLGVLRAQSLLLMALVVLIVNLVHLVILEVGEWRGFLSMEDSKFIQDNDLESEMRKGDIKYQGFRVTSYK